MGEWFMELKVQIKQAGKREQKIQTAKLRVPAKPGTVEDLLRYAVSATYHAFEEKRKRTAVFEAGGNIPCLVLTEEEIENGAAGGKIDFGFLRSSRQVSEAEAIANALLAFADGLIAVFIDKERKEDLSEEINLTGNETVTFVKLTMLAGRLW